VSNGAHRVESLDAFRGFAVASMILVNNPGSWDHVFDPLQHSTWNGCSFADLVFPFFIFILGAAMPFAFARRVRPGRARTALYLRIVRRTVLLIALGLILNATSAPFSVLRIPGVLQRIALVYLATAWLVLHTKPRHRIPLAGALLLVHWALLTLVPFGGAPASMPVPGHNLGAFVDRWIFGRHLLTPLGDPEGLLGTISAIGTALLGTAAGDWIRRPQPTRTRVAGLLLGAGVALAAGLLWAMIWPLNKPLWSGSYALTTAGLAALAFTACYLVIDVARVRAWARPFVWLGVNPLVIYFLSGLAGDLVEQPMLSADSGGTVKTWVFWQVLEPKIGGAFSEEWASLAFAIALVALSLAVAGVMYRRNIRLHV
jgi:predicted acyltransferase